MDLVYVSLILLNHLQSSTYNTNLFRLLLGELMEDGCMGLKGIDVILKFCD